MKTTTNKTASVLRQLFGALLAVVLIVAPLGVSANTGKSITGQPATTPVTTTSTYTPTYTSSYTPSSNYSYNSDDDFNYLDNSYNNSSISIPLSFTWTSNKTNNTNTIYNTGAGSSGSIYSTNNTTNTTSNSTKQQPYSYGDYRSPSVSYDYMDTPYTYGGYNGTYVTYDYIDRPYSYNDYSGTRVHYDYNNNHSNDDDDNNNNNDDEPSCDIDASDTSIEEGDSITLRWDVSGNADSASINNGVGSVDEDGGSKRVSPDEDTTYRLTVRNEAGSDTCSVAVRVGPGNQNNVSLNVTPVTTGGISDQPYTSVYLADAPYTGSGDMVTIVGSIIALLAGALALGYVLFMKGLPFAFKRATVNNAPLVAVAPKKSEAKAIRVGGIDQNEVYAFMNAYAVNDTKTMQSIRAEIKARGVDESRLAYRVSSAASDALTARKFGGATEQAFLTIDTATLEALAA